MLAEEEVAVVEGGGGDGYEEVVGAWFRGRDGCELDAVQCGAVFSWLFGAGAGGDVCMESLRVIDHAWLPLDLLHCDSLRHDGNCFVVLCNVQGGLIDGFEYD